jgi:hypothetical protein
LIEEKEKYNFSVNKELKEKRKMKRKILAIVLMLSITALLVTPIASEPNPNTAISPQITGVDLVAVSIQNTTYVPPITLDNLTGNMLDWKTLSVAYVNYTLHVKYNNFTGPVVYANVGVKRTDIWNSSPDFYPYIFTIALVPGEDWTGNFTWHEETTMMNGIWKISLLINPIGGGDVNPANNEVDSPYLVKSIPDNKTYQVGDLGSATASLPYYQFFLFDGKVNSADTTMYIRCLSGTASANATYLGDLGSAIPSPPYYQFFKYDGIVNSADTTMYIRCLKGQGP